MSAGLALNNYLFKDSEYIHFKYLLFNNEEAIQCGCILNVLLEESNWGKLDIMKDNMHQNILI